MIDRYELLRELGRGGMAVVHLARQVDLQRLVALKELSGFGSGDPAMAERFLRESRLAGSLNHPGIVTVYDFFEDDGTPFISMELVAGGSLRPLIGSLSLQQSALVLEQLLGAVDFAGRQGIVHRDLKPENVLVTEDGRVKVADFGIAKASAAVSGGQSNLTSTGMTVGTPAYMSPEQAMAKDVTPASDLYAIGCMTFELLTGRVPFTDTATMAVLMKHVNEPVPDVRSVDPFAPAPVADWVARMTAKDPDDRPASATKAWEELEDALLELLGPRWRRDAEVQPAGAIDLSDLPPPGATPPGRPRGAASAAPVPGSTPGFETYHAPAALHEVHGGQRATFETPEETAAPVQVLTPPPAPKVTPAPAPAAPPPATLAPAAVVEEQRGFPVGRAVAVAVAALVVGLVVGWSSGGAPEPVEVAGAGFSLRAPADWVAEPVRARGLTGARAVAPAGTADGEAIVAGRLADDADGLLPAGWRPGSAAVRQAQAEGGDAAVLRGARGPDGARDVWALPAEGGTVVVVCPAGGPAAARCPAVAATVTGGGRAAPLGPDPQGAAQLSQVLGRLRDAARSPRQDLRAARSRTAQAQAATDLGRAYRRAAVGVSGAELGAIAVGPQRALRRALSQLASGWRAYATAARAGDGAGAAAAGRRVAAARRAALRARAELARLGYGEQR